MERHAALGPIAWTEGGMRATTRDGFAAWVGPTDHTASRVVTVVAPNGFETARIADSLRHARVIIGRKITRQRDIEARASRPGPEGRTEDAD